MVPYLAHRFLLGHHVIAISVPSQFNFACPDLLRCTLLALLLCWFNLFVVYNNMYNTDVKTNEGKSLPSGRIISHQRRVHHLFFVVYFCGRE